MIQYILKMCIFQNGAAVIILLLNNEYYLSEAMHNRSYLFESNPWQMIVKSKKNFSIKYYRFVNQIIIYRLY